LKKWIPTRRDGFLNFAPMSASLRLDVFVARSASLHLRFELREQFALGLEILEDCLDDDVRLPRSVSGDVRGSTGRAHPEFRICRAAGV